MKIIVLIISCLISISIYGIEKEKVTKTSKQITQINITIPDKTIFVDPMIYGQMLEDCNDKIIYGGLINKDGTEHSKVNELLQSLNMPVVRWPGGTYVHEYNWEKGIGPKDQRPIINGHAWDQIETNQFGTDEFLQWCKKIGTEPYINFNMGNDPVYGGALGDALNWIEYVNGPTTTTLGKKRAHNGHAEPYEVSYWGIGNENYGTWGRHIGETATVYADRLHRWASTIRTLYPNLKLLGVGHVYQWNETVLQKNASLIDYLTLHFYMRSKVKNNILEDEFATIFAPVQVELQIKKNAELLDKINTASGRINNPIRLSIDEWNCRHSVFNDEKYEFTRHDNRRQYDVANIAGMLNVFIRQSPSVGMANYIFPVNGHGLIRTIDETDAYRTPPYYIFELYRNYMVGSKLNMEVKGPTTLVSINKLAVEGDINKELNTGDIQLSMIDGVAIKNKEEMIYVTLINRSHEESQKVKVNLPDRYFPIKMWKLESNNINNANTKENKNLIYPQVTELSKKDIGTTITIPPCGFRLIQYIKID